MADPRTRIELAVVVERAVDAEAEAETRIKPLVFVVLSVVCLFIAWDLYSAFSDQGQQPTSDPATRVDFGVGAQSRNSQPATRAQFPRTTAR